jgi:hypothetical protein
MNSRYIPDPDQVTQLVLQLAALEDPDIELEAAIAETMLGGEIVWKTSSPTMSQLPIRRYESNYHVGGWGAEAVQPYTRSIDAALWLRPQGYGYEVYNTPARGIGATVYASGIERWGVTGFFDTPAALSAACLIAHLALWGHPSPLKPRSQA